MNKGITIGVAVLFTALSTLGLSSSSIFAKQIAHIDEDATYDLSNQRRRTSWFIDSGSANVTVKKIPDSEDYIATFDFDFESSFSILPSKGTMTMTVPAVYFESDFVETELGAGAVFESEAFKAELYEENQKKKHLCKELEECVLIRAYDIKASFDLGGDDAEVQTLSFIASREESLPAMKISSFDLAGKISGLAIRVGGDIVLPESL